MQAGTEKKLAQIEYDYNARKEEINRQEADWKRENKEAGLSTGDNGLTREQQDELEKPVPQTPSQGKSGGGRVQGRGGSHA